MHRTFHIRLQSSFLLPLSCALSLLPVMTAFAQWAPRNPVTDVQQQSDGVLFKMQTGSLKLQVCADSIVRVRYTATSQFSKRPDYVTTKSDWPAAKWTMQSTGDDVIVATSRLTVVVSRKDGAIT